jgi:hypothetical protein
MLITRRRLQRGEEVCLTYSELGNWELLAGYGFTLPDNPLDTALLSTDRIADAASSALGERQCRSRLRALRRSGAWSHLLDVSFVFDRRASPPPELILFLHLVTAHEPPPPWMAESGLHGAAALDARRAAEVARLSDLAPDEALRFISASAPPHAQPSELLARAVRAQLRAYPQTHGPADEGLDTAKRLHARRVVDGEIKIWEAVLRNLGGRDVFVVGTADVGKSTLVKALAGMISHALRLRGSSRDANRRRSQVTDELKVTSSHLLGTTLQAVRVSCFSSSKHALWDTPGIINKASLAFSIFPSPSFPPT